MTEYIKLWLAKNLVECGIGLGIVLVVGIIFAVITRIDGRGKSEHGSSRRRNNKP